MDPHLFRPSILTHQHRRESFGSLTFGYRTSMPPQHTEQDLNRAPILLRATQNKRSRSWFRCDFLYLRGLFVFHCLTFFFFFYGPRNSLQWRYKTQHVLQLFQSERLHPNPVQSMSNGELPLHVEAELADDASIHLLSSSMIVWLAQTTLPNHQTKTPQLCKDIPKWDLPTLWQVPGMRQHCQVLGWWTEAWGTWELFPEESPERGLICFLSYSVSCSRDRSDSYQVSAGPDATGRQTRLEIKQQQAWDDCVLAKKDPNSRQPSKAQLQGK